MHRPSSSFTLTRAFNIPVHDPEKISERAQHVFLELGMACFIYYLREGVVKSLEGHAMQLKDLNHAGAQYKQRLLIERLPRLRREMQLAAERLEEDGELTRCDHYVGAHHRPSAPILLKYTQRRGTVHVHTRCRFFTPHLCA